MDSEKMLPATPPAMLWTGRVLTVLSGLLFLMSAGIKIAKPDWMVKDFASNGFNPDILVGLGILEVACAILYLVPQTAALGAILLTGYLGGAVVAHLRLDQSVVAPVVIGMVLWLGLFLRDARLRTLIPFRESVIK